VVAPGRSIVSLRVPGSYADVLAPGGRVLGDTSGRFFRGSGTSQATAFVAGEAALLLQKRPGLTPAQVKELLRSTARPLLLAHPAMGFGETDPVRALSWPTPLLTPRYPKSSGSGLLEASRGGAHVLDPRTGTPLTGEVDVLGGAWNGTAWASRSGSASSWTGGSWNGTTWTGSGFDGTGSWSAVPWAGSNWAGTSWSSIGTTDAWEARSWRDQSWEARSWRNESWEARSWRSIS
jgi:serine protease AprX